MQRQPAGDAAVVDYRAGCRQPFHEEHLITVEHTQLHVMPDDGVRVFHEGHGGLPQTEGG
jgi:hypothetical protein